MGVGELLDAIRKYYLKCLMTEIGKVSPLYEVIAEPAYRTADGGYATAGALELPSRADIALVQEGSALELLMVDTEGMLSFNPVRFVWEDTLEVDLHPFQWNLCTLQMGQGPNEPDWTAIRLWFAKWFEESEIANGGLFGCVHYVSDPAACPAGQSIDVDFGSASVEAFEELLDSIVRTGFRSVSIGCTTSPST